MAAGRVVTAAAPVMSISFASLIAAQVSFMRMFGLGLTLAILADATLVRMVLLPAFMHVMGDATGGPPKWLTRLHDRIGIDGGGPHDQTDGAESVQPRERCGPQSVTKETRSAHECDCRSTRKLPPHRYTQGEVTEALLALPG